VDDPVVPSLFLLLGGCVRSLLLLPLSSAFVLTDCASITFTVVFVSAGQEGGPGGSEQHSQHIHRVG
jgi:hypothetical protein